MIRIVGILLAAWLTTTAAQADDRTAQARAQVEAADTDYKLARFSEALEKYSKAYELYPAAPLLFNIGQCHRNLKNYDRAIFFFEGYLREDPTASNRALVEDLIRETQAALDQQQHANADLEAQQRAAEQAKHDQEQAAVEAQRVADDRMRQEEADRRRHQEADRRRAQRGRLLSISLVGGGAAAVVGGAVFYYYGQKHGPDQMFVYDDTRILGGTMMVLGGAATVTGTILLVRHPASAPIAAVLPGGLFVGWAGEL